jgi:hypothetical protein
MFFSFVKYSANIYTLILTNWTLNYSLFFIFIYFFIILQTFGEPQVTQNSKYKWKLNYYISRQKSTSNFKTIKHWI